MRRQDVQHGADLEHYRNARGLTQARFAALIGIHRSTYCRWTKIENIRRRRPYITTLLLGVEHLLRSAQTTRKRSARERSYARFSATFPRREAERALPQRITDAVGTTDLEVREG